MNLYDVTLEDLNAYIEALELVHEQASIAATKAYIKYHDNGTQTNLNVFNELKDARNKAYEPLSAAYRVKCDRIFPKK